MLTFKILSLQKTGLVLCMIHDFYFIFRLLFRFSRVNFRKGQRGTSALIPVLMLVQRGTCHKHLQHSAKPMLLIEKEFSDKLYIVQKCTMSEQKLYKPNKLYTVTNVACTSIYRTNKRSIVIWSRQLKCLKKHYHVQLEKDVEDEVVQTANHLLINVSKMGGYVLSIE